MKDNHGHDRPANIMRFWRLVELLTPTSFPKKDPESRTQPVYDLSHQDALPWQDGHPHRHKKCRKDDVRLTVDPDGKEWTYGIYAGLLNVARIRGEIEGWLGASRDNAVRDERKPEGTSLIGFQVSGDGRVIEDSLVLSTFGWAYGQLSAQHQEGTPDASTYLTTEHFEAVEDRVVDRFAAELAGEFVTASQLSEFLTWLAVELELPHGAMMPVLCRVECAQNKPRAQEGKGTEKGSPKIAAAIQMLNSLFSDDLEAVERAVAERQYGPALATYLGEAPATQHDLREDHAATWALLNPELYPKGRWPSAGRFPLVFSQQVAVNQAFRQFMSGSESTRCGLMAVNGPPGTGKTTLLKDVMAGIIVERAVVLASFKTPADALGRSLVGWENRNWTQRYAPLDARLQDFGVVVASSNNGAVENVTMEFPKAEDVDAEWATRASPFVDVATAMLPEGVEAWTLSAACMGNSTNRNAFAETFWGFERKEEPGHTRMPTLLKSAAEGEDLPGILPWKGAVQAFNAAIKREKYCRTVRYDVYEKAHQKARLQSQHRKLKAYAKSFKQSLEVLEQEEGKAQAHHEAIEQRITGLVCQAHATRDQQRQQANAHEATALDDANNAKRWLKACQQEQIEQWEKAPAGIKRLFLKLMGKKKVIEAWDKKGVHLDTQAGDAESQYATASHLLTGAREKAKALVPRLSASEEQQAMGNERIAYHKARQALHDAAAKTQAAHAELDSSRRRIARQAAEIESLTLYLSEHGGPNLITPQDMMLPPEEKETRSPWTDPEWEDARVAVFMAAQDLHDAFVVHGGRRMINNLRGAIKLVRGEAPSDLPDGVARSLWSTLFLMVPLISTTFASFARQFKHLGSEDLGWLLIDEAGQAAPQYAAGALWRSRRALVVGDPLQLEPVVTVPDQLQATLAAYSGVSLKWLPSFTSTQALADAGSAYGSYIGTTWVGAPLLVHRRCESPMFEISNTVAYSNAMVHAKKSQPSSLPPSAWLDVPAREASGHWIPGDGKAVESLVVDMLACGVAAGEIFLISPFRSVVSKLQALAANPQYAGLQAGTIHTVQGKEAKVVILVLGGNPEREGAKKWASQAPNLVNVAVSRAKHRLYMVGDRDAWQKYPFFSECADLLHHQRYV